MSTRTVLRDGREVVVRAVLPSDGEALQRFVRDLSPWTRQARFLAPVRELTRGQLDRILRSRERGGIALVAVRLDSPSPEIVGLAEYAPEDRARAEFGVVVSDSWQRAGLGEQLTEALAARARRAGYSELGGVVLDANLPMLAMAGKLGFAYDSHPEPGTVRVWRALGSRHELVSELGA